jgi:hypothetical protein
MKRNATVVTAILAFIAVGCARTPVRTAQPAPSALLWQDPAAGATADWKPPVPPITFVEEDMDGDSPKFFATDAEGTSWQVKLGPEARTEAAAVRIVTAIGYFAEETHFVEQIRVAGIERQKRGREFITGGVVRDARFEARRRTVRRGATWDWAKNPFVGTIELDALRALMVTFNNYDARTANNRVLDARTGVRHETRYVVADLGASLGHVGGLGGTRSKGHLEGYRSSPFIERVTDGQVYFAYRTGPEGWAKSLFVLNPLYVSGELKKERDLAYVPIPAARWLGDRLAAMPPTVVREAFDDAGYPPEISAGFAAVLADRIRRLSQL